jgi:hypothetical protein
MTHNEMVIFCKQYVLLLRDTPDSPLKTLSEQQMWKVVILQEHIPVEMWWTESQFVALEADTVTRRVYSFIRDNQELFHEPSEDV